MTSLDLRQYVVAPTGTWFNESANFQPALLRLNNVEDGLTLVGPLRVKICILARNRLTHVSAATAAYQTKDVYSYTLEIPPGQSWSYPAPREAVLTQAGQSTLSQAGQPQAALGLLSDAPSGGGLQINTGAGTTTSSTNPSALEVNPYIRQLLLNRALIGANAGAVLMIRPAGPELCGNADPCSEDPCAPKSGCGCKSGCSSCSRGGECGCNGGCGGSSSCGCGSCASTSDLPCDFAVRGQNIGAVFPSPCEPCTPGAPVSMPPTKGPALLVRPAAGGTVRTRFYTGMHMAKEDFETDQKNVRLKRALLNRALGQGVAWGFGLGLDGDGVCVTPGFGLDCCGNDIVLTSPYRVDAASLIADPAAAQIMARRGPHRFSLVLEYFESPQDPRPVHGDPCGLDGARCEPSRIRETVRLRLAPPCDVDDSGPIKDFLAEIEKLRTDPVVGPLFASASTSSCAGSGTTTTPNAVPFTVALEVIGRTSGGPTDGTTNGSPTAPLSVPAPGSPDAQGDTFLPPVFVDARITRTVRITVTAQAGYTFTQSGTPTPIDVATNTALGSAIPLYTNLTSTTQVVWEAPLESAGLPLAAGTDPIPPQFIHRFSGWQLQDGSGGTFTGSVDVRWTEITWPDWIGTPWGKNVEASGGIPVTILNNKIQGVVHLDIAPGQLSTIGGGRRFPCFAEACDPTNVKFWDTFPWLHANPQNPHQAADGRVIVLAVLYAALAGEMAKSSYGTSQYVRSAALEAGSAAYVAASKLYFGTMPDTERFSLTDALQRLLQAWCKALLYPGPTCRCCPHGVVIGCAVVEGGTIVSVDPWGGRRWVVQYPLLSYWGQQFGLMPADAIASRLFGMVCCFASLAAPKFGTATSGDSRARALFVAPGVRPTESVVGRSSAIQFGPATLVVDDENAVDARVKQLDPVRSEALDPITFVTKVTAMIGATGSAPPGSTMVDYSVRGFPGVHFVAPETPSAASVPNAALASRVADVAAAARPQQGQFGRLVGNEVSSYAGKAAAPRLLRPVAEALSYSLAASLPLSVPKEIAAPFTAANIDTVGKVLDRDPEAILAGVLKGNNADAFSGLLDDAEAATRNVTSVVVETIAMAAADKQLTTRADLRAPATQATFTKLLGDRLRAAKIDVAPAALMSAVSEAASG